MSVEITHSGEIAVITIDNPPVNALSQAVRAGLVDAIETINADKKLKGAIITGAGRIFIGGADIKEFGKPPLTPYLPDVIDIIENCCVPTLAAINGAALGGGLEVALGCRYRAGGPKAKTGLPEVNLGLIPGAGGTQRLPRLIGAVKAAEIITSGKPLGEGKAKSAGILDAVFDQNLIENAVHFLKDKIANGDTRPALSSIETPPHWDADAFEALSKKTKARGAWSTISPSRTQGRESRARIAVSRRPKTRARDFYGLYGKRAAGRTYPRLFRPKTSG